MHMLHWWWLTRLVAAAVVPWVGQAAADAPPTEPLDLPQCIAIALENNQRGRISRLAVEVAEAQHRQARSAYWPQVSLRSVASLRDDDPVFIIPAQTDTFRFAGILPAPIATEITVPAIEARLLDRRHFTASLDLLYPIHAGGRRPALVAQARAGVEAARQAVRRSDLRVVLDTRRHFYGAVLARRLLQLSADALARLEVTLELTRSLYENGTGRVTKADYLEHKVVVESLRSAVARLRGDEEVGRAAIVNSIGLPWQTELSLAPEEVPFQPVHADLADLVQASYRLNPDWARLQAGLDAAEAQIREERSGHRPTLAAVGSLEYLANPYDAGIVGPDETCSWVVGIGLEWPLFNGFRTRNAVRAARARLEVLQGQQVLLREGLALQVRHLLVAVARTTEQEGAAGAARQAATENRELNARAYRAGLVEVEELVRTQIIEALTGAQYELVRFEHALVRAELDFVVGGELNRILDGGGS